jgi:nucleoside 2-deoxyribosyltransferase
MKSVVICGSRKFKPEIRKFEKKLKDKGVTVFPPILNTNTRINDLPDDLKRYAFLGLTWHHLESIRKADIVFFYNKDGYIGNSGTLEMGAAAALGKPILALEDEKEEPCRRVLIDEIISSAKELIRRLK